MKKTIKKSFIWALVFLSTVIWWMYAYASVSNIVTSWTTLTASMWNEMAGNYIYSTEEINTGKKRINWKPIYRKVVDMWNLESYQNNDWIFTSVPHNIENIDYVVDYDIIINHAYNLKTHSYHFTWNQYMRAHVNATSLRMLVQTVEDWSDIEIIVEYTKTTD